MEKSVEWGFDTYMQEIFQMKEVDIKEYSPLTLAYIGDCIYDLIIKSLVINEGNRQVQKLHLPSGATEKPESACHEPHKHSMTQLSISHCHRHRLAIWSFSIPLTIPATMLPM